MGTYFRTVLELEGRALREQRARLTTARTGLEDTSSEASSWDLTRAPGVALYENDSNMIKTPHRLGLRKGSPEGGSPVGGNVEGSLQQLDDLVPGVYETSSETQGDLSAFWTTKMAEGWPLIKKNFVSLEVRMTAIRPSLDKIRKSTNQQI